MSQQPKSLLDRILAALNAVERVPAAWRGSTEQNPLEARVRRELLEVAHETARRRLSWGASGCISARSGARAFLISQRATAFDSLESDDLIAQDLKGLDPRGDLGADWIMHREIYLIQPQAKAILQIQPPFTTVLALRETLPPLPTPEMNAFWSTVSWVEFGEPGDKDLAAAAASASKYSKLILMKHRGLVCWSESISELVSLAQTMETVAQIMWLSRST